MTQARDVGRNLACGQLSAFARLRALGNLDFQFIRVSEVLGGHSVAASGYSSYEAVSSCSLTLSLRIISALAARAARALPTHATRERWVTNGRPECQSHELQ